VLWECLVGLVPVTVLTVLTLGVILAGLTTASEAAALGAAGAVVLAICYGRFTIRGLLDACNSTMATTAMVLFLAVGSNVFGAVFSWLGTANWITNMLLASPLPGWATMTLLLGLIFLLGWPFEWPAIVLIFLPLLAPVAKGLGYDMVWFGCVVAVVLQTAFLSPPVAMSAYYLKQVVKEWNLSLIYRGMADFMVLQVICVALVLAFPQIAMWFPTWLQERVKAERMRESQDEDKDANEAEIKREAAEAEKQREREKEEEEIRKADEEDQRKAEQEEKAKAAQSKGKAAAKR
jgi:TRAP-type mannitol/chloroaromatic compound transport system permease large subunit